MKDKAPTEYLDDDRRDYFRIEDDVMLRYLPIDASSAKENLVPEEFQEDLGFSLLRELQHIDQENNQHLRQIAELNRELETYLRNINRKIELVANALAKQANHSQPHDSQKISLSEGGIAFYSNEQHAAGDYLAIQLTLQPSNLTLVLFGQVVQCSPAEIKLGYDYSVSVSFIHLKDSDRQLIAKHIMQIQLKQRRRHSHD